MFLIALLFAGVATGQMLQSLPPETVVVPSGDLHLGICTQSAVFSRWIRLNMQEVGKIPQTATYADCHESLLRAEPTCRESDKRKRGRRALNVLPRNLSACSAQPTPLRPEAGAPTLSSFLSPVVAPMQSPENQWMLSVTSRNVHTQISWDSANIGKFRWLG